MKLSYICELLPFTVEFQYFRSGWILIVSTINYCNLTIDPKVQISSIVGFKWPWREFLGIFTILKYTIYKWKQTFKALNSHVLCVSIFPSHQHWIEAENWLCYSVRRQMKPMDMDGSGISSRKVHYAIEPRTDRTTAP